MIHTRDLTKDFVVSRSQTVQAVRGVDLDIAPGELVAVLGPNGAGKTTTIRMLTTLIAPTSGTATVAGHDIVAEPAQVRRRIGYVGQGNGAGHAQRARDELSTQGMVYGLDRRAARRRADELLESLELRELATRKVSDLSGGQRRRLDVAMGLVHAPSLLFLDEPSTGLDPHNRTNLWEHIAAMRSAHDMTIVLTTHYLDEADAMAERVIVVDHGEVIADDTPDALKTHLAGDRITLTAADPDTAGHLAQLSARLTGARDVTVDGGKVTVRVSDGPGKKAPSRKRCAPETSAGPCWPPLSSCPARFEQLTEDQERERLRSCGYPEDYVEFGIQLAANPPPQAGIVQPTVEQVTGRPARTFAQWAAEHADAFRT